MPITSGITAYDSNVWFWHDGTVHNVPEPTYIWSDGGARFYPEPKGFSWIGRKVSPPPVYDPAYDYANVNADKQAIDSVTAFKKIIVPDSKGDKVTIFPSPTNIRTVDETTLVPISMPRTPYSDPVKPRTIDVPISMPRIPHSDPVKPRIIDDMPIPPPNVNIYPAPTQQTSVGTGVTSSGMTQGSSNANFDFLTLLNQLGFNQAKPLTPSTVILTGGSGTPNPTQTVTSPAGFNFSNINPVYIIGGVILLIILVRK